MNKSSRFLLCCSLVGSASMQAAAEPTAPTEVATAQYTELVVGPFAVHFNNEDEHKRVVLLGLERGETNGWLYGISAFRNSFGQPSAYVYYGYRWDGVLGHPSLYLKLSGGLVYGYKGEYEKKVPLNHNGFGLGVIPAVGYQLTPKDSVQVGVLGTAAMIFTYNRRF